MNKYALTHVDDQVSPASAAPPGDGVDSPTASLVQRANASTIPTESTTIENPVSADVEVTLPEGDARCPPDQPDVEATAVWRGWPMTRLVIASATLALAQAAFAFYIRRRMLLLSIMWGTMAIAVLLPCSLYACHRAVGGKPTWRSMCMVCSCLSPLRTRCCTRAAATFQSTYTWSGGTCWSSGRHSESQQLPEAHRGRPYASCLRPAST